MSDVVYGLGDIHGRLDLLERAESRIAIAKTKIPANQPSVRLMGDCVDEGPNSSGVLDKVITSQLAGLPMQTMLGNHDIWLVRVINMIKSNNNACFSWLNDSTLQTIRSYGISVESVPRNDMDKMKLLLKFARAVPEEHLQYIQNYMSPLSIDAGCIFVHAGLDKRRSINHQSIDVCVNGPENPGGFPESGWNEEMPVVQGHLVKPSPFVSRNLKIIDIDTNAVETGILTCGIFTNGKVAGFMAITPKSGLDIIPVIEDDESIPLPYFRLVSKWWKDVFLALKETPVLIFNNPERLAIFCKLTGIQKYKTANNVNSFKTRKEFLIMPPISLSKK